MFNRIIPAAVLAFCLSTAQAASAPVSGQYVHVVIPGTGKTLSLAEVQVFSGRKNVALKKKTVQTNTASGGNLPSCERGRDCYRFPMTDLVSTSSALSAAGLTVLERLAFELAARGATRAFERT